MIRKAVLTLIAKNYCNWLESTLPPSGKVSVRPFEASALMLIDALPVNSAPQVGEPTKLTEDNIKTALEWIFATVSDAHAADQGWKLACQVMRKDALISVQEIYHRIVNPGKSLDSGHSIPVAPKRPEG
jgi:hypothetical protein